MKEGKDQFCGMTQTFVSVATGARRNIVKNERNDSYWIPKQMYCPNCGTLSIGYQREGLTEFECSRCLTVFVRSYFCSRRHGFQGVGAFMFYVVFVTRLPGCSISGVSRVNSCSVSAGFQVFLKQSFHFLRVRGIDDADTGIVDVDVLMPHAVDLPRFMYHDP